MWAWWTSLATAANRLGPVGDDALPGAGRLVGGDHERAVLVARADELEERAGLVAVLVDVGDVVEDDEVELVEPPDRRFERQVAARRLELLHQVGGSDVEDTIPALDKGEADPRGEMALAGAGQAENDDVVAVVDPVASLARTQTSGSDSPGRRPKSKLSSVLPGSPVPCHAS